MEAQEYKTAEERDLEKSWLFSNNYLQTLHFQLLLTPFEVEQMLKLVYRISLELKQLSNGIAFDMHCLRESGQKPKLYSVRESTPKVILMQLLKFL